MEEDIKNKTVTLENLKTQFTEIFKRKRKETDIENENKEDGTESTSKD